MILWSAKKSISIFLSSKNDKKRLTPDMQNWQTILLVTNCMPFFLFKDTASKIGPIKAHLFFKINLTDENTG